MTRGAGFSGPFWPWLSKEWRDPHWLLRDGVLALFVGVLLLASQLHFEHQATNRAEERGRVAAAHAEQQENLRFVRDRSSEIALDRPFAGIDLRGQNLSGLKLSGADFRAARLDGTDLFDTDLSGAYLRGAHLRGAQMGNANLTGSQLPKADLRGADLSGARLVMAVLAGARMSGANISDATFYGANLSGTGLTLSQIRTACYDRETRWGGGFEPPEPSTCGSDR
jgi:uncharacterized protein YjbI with pentapeptide repeats